MIVHAIGEHTTINLIRQEDAKAIIRSKLGPNPYKGLLAFDEEDESNFFGRSTSIQILREKLFNLYSREGGCRILPVYGPSGSGKSSLVRAGLIPELRKHPYSELLRPRIVVFTPEVNPLQSLAESLAHIVEQKNPTEKNREFIEKLYLNDTAGNCDGLQRITYTLPESEIRPLILVVDQFEEIYSLCKDVYTRDIFVKNLLYSAQDISKNVSVILTMRNDFMKETHQHPNLGCLFSEQGYLVPPMNKTDLREIIVEPAKNNGYDFDEGVISLLIEQSIGQPGTLPLLQFALEEIWKKLESSQPAETLNDIEGVSGAIAKKAEAIYEGLTLSEQRISRKLFLGLVQLGEGAQDTRRRVVVESLIAEKDFQQTELIKRVIQKFSSYKSRLIILSNENGKEVAEVSYEALIRHWPLLKQWLNEGRVLLLQQRRIESAAEEWKRQHKDDLLFQGKLIAESNQFCKEHGESFPLSKTARVFLKASSNRKKKQQLSYLLFLIFPFVAVDLYLYEKTIREYYYSLSAGDMLEKRHAVENLTSGCNRLQSWPLAIRPAGERFLGNNCRSLRNNADLAHTDLSNIDLRGVDLTNADLSDANLNKAILVNAILEHADLRNAELVDTDLSAANLIAADLTNADLSGAALNDANLQSANLSNSDLTFAAFRRADVSYAKFTQSNLQDTDFSGANLRNSDIGLATMTDTILLGTDLRFIDHLSIEQIERNQSILLCNTVLPDLIDSLYSRRFQLELIERSW